MIKQTLKRGGNITNSFLNYSQPTLLELIMIYSIYCGKFG